MSPRFRHLLQIHVAVLLFGFAGLFGKFLTFAPVIIVFGRVLLAALALLLVLAVRRAPLRRLAPRALLAFLALGSLLAVHWITFFKAVQESSVALALITYSTFPVFVVLLEPAFFRERLRPGDAVLALIALAGIVVLVPSPELSDRTTQGVLWGVASGLTFAVLSLLNRASVQHYPSTTIALYQDAFAAAVLLPFAVWDWPSFTLEDVLLLVVLGVVCTALAHALFIAGMRGVPARTASMIACLEPVYGSILAAILLDELPTVRTVLGGVLVVGVACWATVRAGKDGAGPHEMAP